MPFNNDGIYTRVSNSFSDPVAGTEIDPVDADLYFDDIDGALNAQQSESTTSLLIGTGTKAFTVEPDKDFPAPRFVFAYSQANSANYMHGQVTSFVGDVVTVNVTSVGGSGTYADWILEVSGPQGPQGNAATVTAGTTITGAAGTSASVLNSGTTSAAVFDFTIPRGATPAVGFNFSTTTTDSDPGSGNMRFNNATPASVTMLYVDNTSAAGQSVTAWLDSFDDSTTTSPYGVISLTDTVTPSTQLQFNVTNTVVDGTGYRKITVTHVSGTTLPANGDLLGMTFSRTGNAGAGNIGGSTGATDNAVLRADGTGGVTLQNSPVTIADTTGVIAGTQGVTFSGSSSGTTTLQPAAAAGSTTITMPAATDTMAVLAASQAFTNKTYNGNTLTAGTFTLTGGSGKTFTFSNTLTLTGTDSTSFAFPSTSSTVLTTGNTALITKGYTVTPNNIGTVSSGTTTPAAADGNYQYLTNNGAFTLAAPAADCAIDILVTNGASAGSITFSGFTVGSATGSTYNTTNTNKFLLSIRRINSVSTYSWYALQ